MAYNFGNCLICRQVVKRPSPVAKFQQLIQDGVFIEGHDFTALTLPADPNSFKVLEVPFGQPARAQGVAATDILQTLVHARHQRESIGDMGIQAWLYFFELFTKDPGYCRSSSRLHDTPSWHSSESRQWIDRLTRASVDDVDSLEIASDVEKFRVFAAGGEARPFFLLRHAGDNVLYLAHDECFYREKLAGVGIQDDPQSEQRFVITRQTYYWYFIHPGVFANAQNPAPQEMDRINPRRARTPSPDPSIHTPPRSPAPSNASSHISLLGLFDSTRHSPAHSVGTVFDSPIYPSNHTSRSGTPEPPHYDYRKYLIQPADTLAMVPSLNKRIPGTPFIHRQSFIHRQFSEPTGYVFKPPVNDFQAIKNLDAPLTSVVRALQTIYDHPEANINITQNDQLEAINTMLRVAELSLPDELRANLAVTPVVTLDIADADNLAPDLPELDVNQKYHIWKKAGGKRTHAQHYETMRASAEEQVVIVPICFTSDAEGTHFGYLVILKKSSVLEPDPEYDIHLRILKELNESELQKVEFLAKRAIFNIFNYTLLNVGVILINAANFFEGILNYQKPDLNPNGNGFIQAMRVAPHDAAAVQRSLSNVFSQAIIMREIPQLMVVDNLTRRYMLLQNFTESPDIDCRTIESLMDYLRCELGVVPANEQVTFHRTLIPQFETPKYMYIRLQEHVKELESILGLREFLQPPYVALNIEHAPNIDHAPNVVVYGNEFCARHRNKLLMMILLILLVILGLIFGLVFGLHHSASPPAPPAGVIDAFCNATNTNVTLPNANGALSWVNATAAGILAPVIGYFYQPQGDNIQDLVLVNNTDNGRPVPCAYVPYDPTIPYDTTPFVTENPTITTASTISTPGNFSTFGSTLTTNTTATPTTVTLIPLTTNTTATPTTPTTVTLIPLTTNTTATPTTPTTVTLIPLTTNTTTTPTTTTVTLIPVTTEANFTTVLPFTTSTEGNYTTVEPLPTATLPPVPTLPITEVTLQPTIPTILPPMATQRPRGSAAIKVPSVHTYTIQLFQGYDPISQPFKGFLVNARGGVRIKSSLKGTWAVLWEYKAVGTSSLWGEPDFTGAMTIPQYKQFMAGLEGLRVQLTANVSEKRFNRIAWAVFNALERNLDFSSSRILKKLNKDFLKHLEFVKTAKVEHLNGSVVKLLKVLRSVFADKVRFYTDGARQQVQ